MNGGTLYNLNLSFKNIWWIAIKTDDEATHDPKPMLLNQAYAVQWVPAKILKFLCFFSDSAEGDSIPMNTREKFALTIASSSSGREARSMEASVANPNGYRLWSCHRSNSRASSRAALWFPIKLSSTMKISLRHPSCRTRLSSPIQCAG